MTLFLQDLRDYLVDNSLATNGQAFIDFYPDGEDDFITLSCYAHDADQDARYIQVMARDTSGVNCLTALNAIYNHFFDSFSGKAGNKTVNSIPCYFRALTKPAYLKRFNNLFYYVFNMKVTNINA